MISRLGAGGSSGANFPVGPVTNFYAVAGNAQVELSWTNPGDEYIGNQILVAEFGRVDLWCNEDHVPERPGDGYLVEPDAQSPFMHIDVENDVGLFYQAFTYTTKGVVNLDAGPGASATPRNQLVVGDLPVGTLIRARIPDSYQSRLGDNILWIKADANHPGYPENSTTIVNKDCLLFVSFDVKEPSNSDTNRRGFGNNRFSVSNLYQWSNSTAEPGRWYSKQHSADEPPSNANVFNGINDSDTWPGFLKMLGTDFTDILLDTSVVTARADIDGGGTETVVCKLFPASTTEIGLGNENNVPEGSLIAFFSDNISRIAYPTDKAVSASESKEEIGVSTACRYWLRTGRYGYTMHARIVDNLGALAYYSAWYGAPMGLRMFGNIPNATLVSNQPNTDGSYNLIF